MAKAHKEKKEKREKFIKFQCPYTDVATGQKCPQSYFSFKYEGAEKHLTSCIHFDAGVFAAYIKEKGIKIS